MVGEQADSHCPGRTLRPWSRQAETAHLADIHDDVATARLTNWDPSGHLPHPLYSVLELVGRGHRAGGHQTGQWLLMSNDPGLRPVPARDESDQRRRSCRRISQSPATAAAAPPRLIIPPSPRVTPQSIGATISSTLPSVGRVVTLYNSQA